MGSKAKHAKELLPIILKHRKSNQYYVEPFVGGCNMIDKVGGLRIGNDYNFYLIEFFKALQNSFVPPNHITLEQYNHIKNNKDEDPKMTCWAGICCSYGGKWFGGYINDYSRLQKNGKRPNHQLESKNQILKQYQRIKNVHFINKSYIDINLKPNCLIYNDPPYAGTTEYKDKFDHEQFWEWCREKVREGHLVYTSEYTAPDDFICIKEINTATQMANGSGTGNLIKIEKLFIHKSQSYLHPELIKN